ncbi:hypothetical protein BJ508DRAFT_225075 [Ascobolus immersus RN42]|uniref:Zn(2)-C6 fungal-type domain-containing protein n=1 Tax=Ascobolus immersus RN42 TaxID=1160509 RepID=A0A3N4I829_ASCIM|nr:hypothetical protein BJ508DRAFT_225075 [Ascobolus immersus RN42]
MSAPPPLPTLQQFLPQQQQPPPSQQLPQASQPPPSDSHLPTYPVTPAKPPRVHSCVLCQQRKVKCDRQTPCSNCKKARVECLSSVSIRPRRRKRRFPEAELLARLRKYEDMLKELGVKLEGDGEKEVPNVEGNGGTPGTEQEEDGCNVDEARVRKTSVNGAWAAMSDEFRDIEEALLGSSEDELETSITRTYDSLYTSDGTELLGFPSNTDIDLTAVHPNPIQICQLWQVFLENVNPLLKIFHTPTTQQQVFQIAGSPGMTASTREMDALLFGIYAFAVVTMDEGQCEMVFGAGNGSGGKKKEMLAKFHYGCRIALVRADFMRSGDITVLQAFLLYLHSVRQILDPRSLFLLTGLSIRIAQRLNLHRPMALTPFETELRRRLWWQLLLLDTRMAELSGSGTSSLTTHWTTPLPSNINDAALYPAMTTPPPSTQGITESLFILLRSELLAFTTTLRLAPPKSREKAISDLESHLNTTYLTHADPNIPLHALTLLTASTALAKMRLHLYTRTTPPSREQAFTHALTMLQNLAACFSNRTIITNWKWFVVMNIPLDAYIFILSSLRLSPSDNLALKAWAVLDELNRTRDLTKRREGQGEEEDVMHQRLCSLAVKAWEAREKREGVVPVPGWIARAREEVRRRRKGESEGSTPGFGGMGLGVEMGGGLAEGGLNGMNTGMNVGGGLGGQGVFGEEFMGGVGQGMEWYWEAGGLY